MAAGAGDRTSDGTLRGASGAEATGKLCHVSGFLLLPYDIQQTNR